MAIHESWPALDQFFLGESAMGKVEKTVGLVEQPIPFRNECLFHRGLRRIVREKMPLAVPTRYLLLIILYTDLSRSSADRALLEKMGEL